MLASAATELQLWPRPAHSTWSAGCVRLPLDGPTLTAAGPGANSDVTRSATERDEAIFRTELLDPVPVDPTVVCESSAPLLVDLKIHIDTDLSEPHLGVDESFTLNITSQPAPSTAIGLIQAATPFGALHGLEGTALRRLYEWDGLVRFVGEVLQQNPEFYRLADPLGT